MINFIKFSELKLEQAAIDLIQFEVFKNYHLFDEFTLKQDYNATAHEHTKTIPLRLGKSITPETTTMDLTEYAMLDEMEFEDWPIFQNHAFNNVDNVITMIMDHLDLSELGWVTLVSLAKKKSVFEHKDEGEYCKNFHRFHVCLYCDSEAKNHIIVNGHAEEIHQGDVFTFDNKSTHSADNWSETQERIHLIFDAR